MINRLAQDSVDARLPAWTAGAEMVDDLGIEAQRYRALGGGFEGAERATGLADQQVDTSGG